MRCVQMICGEDAMYPNHLRSEHPEPIVFQSITSAPQIGPWIISGSHNGMLSLHQEIAILAPLKLPSQEHLKSGNITCWVSTHWSSDDLMFQEWWRTAKMLVPKEQHADFNSLVMLVAWWLWKHQNDCVFEGSSPSTQWIIQGIIDDAKMWCMAGAKGFGGMWP
ncbi:hypothetical protein PR202_gb12240 [Eleusine coracana subsp. coracana]|uniref:Uncharacterized protein n=1 Tax=Eleusine coracana subsp. coracana TaxID=191504 RepID=A0AAV5ENU2_ELECO|nr:hypothetical protein PR202_gb12240 [Eleusine coracana subsp. coracana]